MLEPYYTNYKYKDITSTSAPHKTIFITRIELGIILNTVYQYLNTAVTNFQKIKEGTLMSI